MRQAWTALGVLLALPALAAAETQTRHAGTVSSSSFLFSSSVLGAPNSACAVSNGANTQIAVREFGFAIPDGSTITAVDVDVKSIKAEETVTNQAEVELIWSTTNNTFNFHVEVPGSGTASASCGASEFRRDTAAPLWGTSSLTPDVINDPTFGVNFIVRTGDLIFVDAIRVTVTFTPPPLPVFTKAFDPASIVAGEVSRLTFTIDHTSGSGQASSLAFEDMLPAGILVASVPNAATTCTGGSLAAVAGGNVISYTGGSVAAEATCTVSVDVTSSTPGAHLNTSGNLTSSLGNSGPASSTLTVVAQTGFSVEAPTGGGDITGSISGHAACTIAEARATTPEAIAAPPPPGVEFPHGLVDLRVTGCPPGATVTFTITFPDPLPPNAAYWKYGPTPQNATPHWYVLPATIDGSTVTYTITDGQLGDDDLVANGTIEDPGGPGLAQAVPALPVWTLIILATLLLVALRRAVRRTGMQPV